MEITLEDVEIAIRVLNEFMRRTRQATITMRRMDVTFKGSMERMPQSFNDFVNLAYKQVQAKKQAEESPQEEPAIEPPSDEDIARMREIKEKIKGRAP